jgi:hypothetical protein
VFPKRRIVHAISSSILFFDQLCLLDRHDGRKENVFILTYSVLFFEGIFSVILLVRRLISDNMISYGCY